MKYLLALSLFVIGCNTNYDAQNEVYKVTQIRVLAEGMPVKSSRFPKIESSVALTTDSNSTHYTTDSLSIQIDNDGMNAFVTGDVYKFYNDGSSGKQGYMVGLAKDPYGKWQTTVIEMY